MERDPIYDIYEDFKKSLSKKSTTYKYDDELLDIIKKRIKDVGDSKQVFHEFRVPLNATYGCFIGGENENKHK